jgi:nicotinamidase-related amidase
MSHPRVLERDASVLLIIDVQEGYRGHTVQHDRMVRSVRRLLDAANLMGVPVIATEQYPKGLGHTQPEVSAGFPPDLRVIEKRSMSCCGQPAFVERLRALGRRQVVVCGIEAHACVNQTVHDLLHDGHTVHVPYDAISARFEHDLRIGWDKMITSGAVASTVEMACLEWVRTADHPQFKALHRLIK